jgi:hypothetical protein
MVVKTYFVYSDDDDRRRRRGGGGGGCDGSWYPSQARNNSLGLVHRYIALITFIIFIFI